MRKIITLICICIWGIGLVGLVLNDLVFLAPFLLVFILMIQIISFHNLNKQEANNGI